jgi:TonB family protein
VNNLISYALQILLVVAFSAVLPPLLRIRMPGSRLAFWQSVLVTSLVLPLIRPWQTDVSDGLVTVTSNVTKTSAAGHAWSINLLWIVGAGIGIRLILLGTGLIRLGWYRRNARPFDGEALLSDDVTGPVTFGFLKPVILLPATFPELEDAVREAILCHERLHIQRNDWLMTVGEEIIRAVFWFHPAVWWMLGEIQLAREQVVDRAVVARTQLPERYVDALLAVAGAAQEPDLAPAPLFLRRRHLKQRVFSLLKEKKMSRAKSLSTLAAGLGMMVAACWFVTGAIPLKASPADEPAKRIRVGGNVMNANLMEQKRPAYPPEAKAARVQGVVRLSVDISAEGKVENISVISGPPELIQSAVDAVKEWVYKPTLLNGEPVAVSTTVDVNYTLSQ